MTQTTLKPSEYRCAMCGTIYDLTDFDAEAELGARDIFRWPL